MTEYDYILNILKRLEDKDVLRISFIAGNCIDCEAAGGLSFDFDDYGDVDGDILALRTFDLNRECRKNIPNNNKWEWLATPDSTPSSYGSDGVQCVGSSGEVSYGWCGSCGAVRPFFILQS